MTAYERSSCVLRRRPTSSPLIWSLPELAGPADKVKVYKKQWKRSKDGPRKSNVDSLIHFHIALHHAKVVLPKVANWPAAVCLEPWKLHFSLSDISIYLRYLRSVSHRLPENTDGMQLRACWGAPPSRVARQRELTRGRGSNLGQTGSPGARLISLAQKWPITALCSLFGGVHVVPNGFHFGHSCCL